MSSDRSAVPRIPLSVMYGSLFGLFGCGALTPRQALHAEETAEWFYDLSMTSLIVMVKDPGRHRDLEDLVFMSKQDCSLAGKDAREWKKKHESLCGAPTNWEELQARRKSKGLPTQGAFSKLMVSAGFENILEVLQASREFDWARR